MGRGLLEPHRQLRALRPLKSVGTASAAAARLPPTAAAAATAATTAAATAVAAATTITTRDATHPTTAAAIGRGAPCGAEPLLFAMPVGEDLQPM